MRSDQKNIKLNADNRELPAVTSTLAIWLIGNKWRLCIAKYLSQGKARFTDLKIGIPGISQKVLTDNLRIMEAAGVVERTAYAEVPPRVEYELTDIGNSGVPILDELKIWGEKYATYCHKHGIDIETVYSASRKPRK
ncbi:MAG: winged helix-turn-helix transcriptional regulator [Candidatus Nomurabacteria bacterium]|nr:winged helix-turn-helix transcriptional regulator [Candidatus Nomurabacteria bacterium]